MKYATTVSAALLLLLSFSASASSINQLKTVGKAEMRWLFFPLFQVALKTSDGRYQESRYPQALDILYRRDIEKKYLLVATDRQWQRLNVTAAKRQQWLKQLGAIWPTIKRGDRLGFSVNADGSNHFIYNGRNIGGINDKNFGASFLAIWLSPKTSQPGIREVLISAKY